MLPNINNLSFMDITKILVIVNTILYNILVLPILDKEQLEIFDNILVRGLIILFIIGSSYYEQLIALLLSISFVLTHVRYYYLSKKKSEHFFNSKKNNNNMCMLGQCGK
jgi:hypothetical protein